ncbi:hypothetical protein K458DRAFT_414560, partial [Lentithecium fluviatile CBS 122367]
MSDLGLEEGADESDADNEYEGGDELEVHESSSDDDGDDDDDREEDLKGWNDSVHAGREKEGVGDGRDEHCEGEYGSECEDLGDMFGEESGESD